MERTLLEQKKEAVDEGVPLAAALRPRKLNQVIGHENVLGKDKVFRKAIESGTTGSLIFWGPPGVGKTTLAYLIAEQVEAKVERVSAVAAGVKDLRAVIERATQWKKLGNRTVLIIDEIHRFNKAQQDVLLPHVEDGLVTLIGATTENPYFEVIAALVSRAEIIRLEKLSDQAIITIVKRAGSKLSKDASELISKISGGDARRALNILERASLANKNKRITKKDIASAAQQAARRYDKGGDAHYDTISAFIKSMRGSDTDATLFYLFKMIMSGEDPKFLIRRMFVFASEDIGNADPHALMVVSGAAHALEWVGLPEAEYALAHCATYLSAAPKSNSVKVAMDAVKQDVEFRGNEMPPDHVTNAPIEELKKHGKGVGYKYPHDYAGGLVKQQYRPNAVQNNTYYKPGEEGFEKEVKRRVDAARKVLHDK
jgi:putative ATPase